ncbi:MAG: hypothetical protein SFV54_07040 [Bryobacteraceae bacterium]|nr:hypothetical protein [Bryobacteraceae bacterium]
MQPNDWNDKDRKNEQTPSTGSSTGSTSTTTGSTGATGGSSTTSTGGSFGSGGAGSPGSTGSSGSMGGGGYQGGGQQSSGQRGGVAGVIERAADRLRDAGPRIPGGDRTTQYANRAADGLRSTADYVRTADAKAVANDIKDTVRRHPTETLIGALIAGFLVGRAFRGGRG